MNESDKNTFKKFRSLERKLDMVTINALENEIKKFNTKVQVPIKSQIDFEREYCVGVRNDKYSRELEVTCVTAKCAWVKGNDDKKLF